MIFIKFFVPTFHFHIADCGSDWRPAQYRIGGFFGNHHGAGVDDSADDIRKDGRVDDAKLIKTTHFEVRTDDRFVICPHAAGATGMKNGVCGLSDIGVDIFIAFGGGAGRKFRTANAVKGRLADNSPDDEDGGAHGFPVGGCRTEIIEDFRRCIRFRRRQPDRSPGFRAQVAEKNSHGVAAGRLDDREARWGND